MGCGGGACLPRAVALLVQPSAEWEAVLDGVAGDGEVAVGLREGFGVFDGGAPGVGALGAGVGYFGGDAEGGQEVLLVWVELVVLEAGSGDPAAQDGALCGDAGDGVIRFAGFDVVAGAVVVALSEGVPGRVPPGVDRGEFGQVG